MLAAPYLSFFEETGAQLENIILACPDGAFSSGCNTPRAEALGAMFWMRHRLRDMGSEGRVEQKVVLDAVLKRTF